MLVNGSSQFEGVDPSLGSQNAKCLKSRANYSEKRTSRSIHIYRHGLRVSEACDLRWDDIDLPKRTIIVRRLKASLSRTLHEHAAPQH
jgi:integrase